MLPPIGAVVEGFWYGEWLPGKVYRHILATQPLEEDRVEIYWEGMVSELERWEVRYSPGAAAEKRGTGTPENRKRESEDLHVESAKPRVMASSDLRQVTASLRPTSEAPPPPFFPSSRPSLEETYKLEPGLEETYREEEGITPSDGFLSAGSVGCHPWICHMCRKKFMCVSLVPEHLRSKGHTKKKALAYQLADWVEYNRDGGTSTFYELDLPPVIRSRR